MTANDADLVPGPDAAPARRPAIWKVVVRRELGRSFAVLLLLSVVAGMLAARHAAATLDGSVAATDRLIRRFDLTALSIAALLALLRIPTRVEHDHRDGWLTMFVAAGASRIAYITGVVAGAYIASAACFVATAVAFAAGVYVHTAATELLAILPVTIGSGLLLLASWCVWSGFAAVLFRRALPAFFAAAVVALFPHVLIVARLTRMETPDAWLVGLARTVPPLLPATAVPVALWQLAVLTIIAGAAAHVARRLIGRHA